MDWPRFGGAFSFVVSGFSSDRLVLMSDPNAWHKKETYKGLITLSQSALRGAAIVNGGAAVALLAFIGRIYSGDISILFNPSYAIFYPMLLFIGGLLAAGLASGAAYVAQFSLFNLEMGRKETLPRIIREHAHWIGVGVGLFVLSYLCFAGGAALAAYQLI